MAHPLVRNAYRSSRETALNLARECRRWRKVHQRKGEWCEAANVHQAMLGYLSSFRRLSAEQRAINRRWEGMPGA